MPSDDPSGTTGQYRIHAPARLAIAGHGDRQKKPGTTVQGQEIHTHNNQSLGHILDSLLFEIEKSLL
jgi:hypothetical protein